MKNRSMTRKIPGGKLIRIDVVYSNHIEHVKITGDFFLHPEDVLEQIEEIFAGRTIPLEKDDIIGKIEAIIDMEGAELIGVAPHDILNTIEEALECPSE